MTKFFRNAEEAIGLAIQSVLWVVLFGVGMRAGGRGRRGHDAAG